MGHQTWQIDLWVIEKAYRWNSAQILLDGLLSVDQRSKSHTLFFRPSSQFAFLQRTKGLEKEEGTGGKDCSKTEGDHMAMTAFYVVINVSARFAFIGNRGVAFELKTLILSIDT